MINDTIISSIDSDEYEAITLNGICEIKANDKIHLTPFKNEGNQFNFSIIEL